MKTTFICLANSKKYGERCISGIIVEKSDRVNFKVVKDDNQPKWIRPISHLEHGEISAKLIKDIKVLNIVELEITKMCPNGYQSENVLFRTKSLKIVSSVSLSKSNLDKLIDDTHPILFGNTGKAVSTEYIHVLNYSLMFIKPQKFEVYEKCYAFKKQFRGRFTYHDVQYDLPITDISFLNTLNEGIPYFNQDNVYLTVSLGIEFECRHYKLIAGVIIATK